MNYKEVTEYLFEQTPNYEKQGQSGYKEGLGNTDVLDEHFGHPHRNFKSIHIAGTNGKGSCSHTLAAHLQTCGYKVGLYTSPHLLDFRERIRINGMPVSENYVVEFVTKNKELFDSLHASFFEITTAMAFKYFSDREIDIAVVEVGLGGRLDCTNVITPLVSVITNISLDHTEMLGNSLEQIAMEKGGIIKPGVPVVIGEATPETRMVFDSLAKDAGAPIVYAEDEQEIISSTPRSNGGFHYVTNHLGEIDGELGGIYQPKNTNTVLNVLKVLMRKGYLCHCETEETLRKVNHELNVSLGKVCKLTGLMGRWQTIQTAPLVVCDTGHNVGGWQYLSKQLANIECDHMHIVFGMMEDKDVYGVLELMPKTATYYFTKPQSKRAMSEQSLQVFAHQIGLQGNAYPTVKEAIAAAMKQARANDFVFVGGSNYVVAEFLRTRI